MMGSRRADAIRLMRANSARFGKRMDPFSSSRRGLISPISDGGPFSDQLRREAARQAIGAPFRSAGQVDEQSRAGWSTGVHPKPSDKA